MKAFQAAFVAADKSLDERVCKDGTNGGTDSDKCKTSTGTNDATNSANNLGYAYQGGGANKIDAKDADNIATSLSKLSKEEKATLAAAFAKAVEGACCMRGARVELEVGYERFKVSGPREEGSKRESEEGIYLLAKELAVNTVRDNTTRLGLGIGRLSKGDLKAFHAAFVAADAGLDKKVCRNGTGNDNDGKKCKAGDTDANKSENNLGYAYQSGGAEKVGATDADHIATSLSKLSKEEKATLAAAFAKAVEGACCMRGARVELEVWYERLKVSGPR